LAALLAALSLLAAGVATPAVDGTSCEATPVHFTAGGARGLSGVPWVRSGRAFRGFLFSYASELADGRVNQSSGAVLYTRGGTRAFSTKILWVADRPRATAIIRGRQLDGSSRFSQKLSRAGGGGFPSIIRIPAAGCWKLAIRSGPSHGSIVVRAIDPPDLFSCDSTPVHHDSPSRSGDTVPWLRATPVSSGITGTVFYPLPPGVPGLTIYPHRQAPKNADTKILWEVPRGKAGRGLVIRAQRLDASAAVPPQKFPAATGSSAGTLFPSGIDVSSTGCWLLTVRSGKAAGIVVANSIPTG
jgi:hypothetical protein